MLEMVSRDVKSLKDRQDLLFRKQDMLQSTLAGEVEIPVGQAHSRTVSSILAWSSEPGSPAHPRFERPSETPPVKQPLQGPQYAPVYAPPAHSLVDSHSVYAYSIDDVSSFLSEQWEGPAANTACCHAWLLCSSCCVTSGSWTITAGHSLLPSSRCSAFRVKLC